MSLSKYILMIWVLWLSSAAHAEIKARVDRNSIYLGESLTLTIKSDQNTNSQPDFTLLDAVFHVGQTGKSSSTQIINGQVNTETAWQVLLVPKSIGQHIIPPLEVDGEQTEVIKIEVKKPDPKAQAKGDIFIEIESNKKTAYVQEEILLTVRLLYAINLKNGTLTEPEAEGLITQHINKGANYTTQRDGKTYQVLERKYAMYAENSGTLTLNPIIFEGEVTDNSRQSFGMFQRGRPVRKISEMLELEIKQIPQDFVDQAWIPAKQVVIQQSWSQNKPYKVGEPITRTINLTATGLTETQLPDFDLQDIEGAKTYQDKTETMTRSDGQQLIATKVIKYAVIPTSEGQLEIPAFTLPWFDTQSQTTRTATIPATSLAIEAGAVITGNPQSIDFNPVAATEPDVEISAEPIISPTAANSHWWRTLTFGFAALWVLTLLLFWLKVKGRPPAAKVQEQQLNRVSTKNLNQAAPAQVQATLLAWWNQEHGQRATNLGQIRDQLAAGQAREAVSALQDTLYGGAKSATAIDWQQLIKQGAFKPANPKVELNAGLPELYSS